MSEEDLGGTLPWLAPCREAARLPSFDHAVQIAHKPASMLAFARGSYRHGPKRADAKPGKSMLKGACIREVEIAI